MIIVVVKVKSIISSRVEALRIKKKQDETQFITKIGGKTS